MTRPDPFDTWAKDNVAKPDEGPEHMRTTTGPKPITNAPAPPFHDPRPSTALVTDEEFIIRLKAQISPALYAKVVRAWLAEKGLVAVEGRVMDRLAKGKRNTVVYDAETGTYRDNTGKD